MRGKHAGIGIVTAAGARRNDHAQRLALIGGRLRQRRTRHEEAGERAGQDAKHHAFIHSLLLDSAKPGKTAHASRRVSPFASGESLAWAGVAFGLTSSATKDRGIPRR